MLDKLDVARMAPSRGVGVPLYVQLAARLRAAIADGDLDSGALPSERLLSERVGASRVTVRKAIEQLVSEGLLTRRQGSGTYVSARIEQRGQALTGFTADVHRRGHRAGSMWISRSVSAATEEEARLLEIDGDATVARLARVRLEDGEPLAIEHAVVPQHFLPDINEVQDSLYAALAAAGARPASGRQRLNASAATSIEAGLLSIHEGDAILRIERLSRLGDGTPVELTRSAYRGDRFTFVTDLSGTAE